jgi:hypothetical protein
LGAAQSYGSPRRAHNRSRFTKLNPLKGLDAEGRRQFAQKYRELQEFLDSPSDRLSVMDSQGIQCAVNFATLPGIEVEFEDDFDGLYANLTALNRYLGEEWGYNYENRLFTPPFISFADPDAALQLLEEIMRTEAPRVIQTSSGPSMHTSAFREHCFVAPFPEENVPRVVDAIGVDPIVFGSDFPHGEGLPDPGLYLGQIATLPLQDQAAIMRGNLARYLGLGA